jgi:VWFA-related protein
LKSFTFQIATLLIASAATLAAADPAPQAQTAPSAASRPATAGLVEHVDVNVINIDVVVTDRKTGKHIVGLKPADFEVYENGEAKPITNFYEVTEQPAARAAAAPAGSTAGPAPAAPPASMSQPIPDRDKRRFILFIDNLSISFANRRSVFAAMKRFLSTALRPEDEAMIATWNRSMKVRVPFTHDRVILLQTLDSISEETAYGNSNASERHNFESQIRDSDTYDNAVQTARQYAESVNHDMQQTASALQGLMATLAGVEGKKALVITSEGFPMQPGREMFAFIEDLKTEKKGWGSGGSALMEGMSYDASSTIESIARAANANSITLYTIHAGGLDATMEGSAENSKPVSYSVQQAALSNSTESLQMLASMTGGLATVGTSNFDLAFRGVAEDLSSYYSIGYRAGTERVDRQRTIEVKMKNRRYEARSRQTYVEKSTATDMTDRVTANVFYPTSVNDLGIITRMGDVKPADDGTFRVALDILIPWDKLTLLPQGEVRAGSFTAFVVVANKDGDMSNVIRQNHELRLAPDELQKAKGKYFTYTFQLIMEPGHNRVSIGVVDDVTNLMGFSRAEITPQDLR